MSEHVVLLGDSIFDNASYTGLEPDVVNHLRAILPDGWRATLCAVDGATTLDLATQLGSLPRDASQLVLSLGGNDALLNSDLLNTQVSSTAEALALFAVRLEKFEIDYRRAVASIQAVGKPWMVCTIYNGNLAPTEQRNARTALAMFNDVILRVALAHSVDVLDLRAVCTHPSDYANPIEPSGSGGMKIARAIAGALGVAPTRGGRTTLSAG